MKLSARNQLKGKIVEIQEGAVNAIVKINVGNDNILTADITVQSVKELGNSWQRSCGCYQIH